MSVDALPSLFRWEPGMQPSHRPHVVTDVEVVESPDGVETYLHFGAAGFESADDCQPNMGHAGTRGLMLEQVRAALGRPLISTFAIEDQQDGETVVEWRLGAERGAWYGRGETEGEAVMDALRRESICRG